MPRFIVLSIAFWASSLLIIFGQAPTDSPVLQYSTFLDGSGGELIRDIVHDAEGNIYVTGGTYSTNFPTTPGAYQTTLNPGVTPPGTNDGSFQDMDVFITKFDSDGNILWSTLLGGPQYDRAYGIELDAEGNVYVGGRAGPAFPVTSGAIQEDFIFDTIQPTNGYGDQDAFIAKLSADGSTLLWATYVGSPAPSLMRDFRVDAVNGVVHCGVNRVAGSFAHITTGALQSTFADDNDAAYLKLDADDGSLLYGTLLGGNGDDYRPSLVTDDAGGVYFMLQSDSTNLPTPAVGFEQGPNGGADFVIYHFDMNNTVVSATHYGGSGDEFTETHSIARDASGNIFLGGGTSSTNLPATAGSAQPTKANLNDSFLAKLSADLSTVIASTYTGGSDGDGGEGVHVAPDGTVYLAGPTKSVDWPTTTNALLPNFPGGGRNGVLTRYTNDLSTVLYNSYVGGSDDDDARIAYVTDDGDLYVGGIARSNNFPTLNATDTTQTGAFSAFLMKFSLEEPADPDNENPVAVATASATLIETGQSVTFDASGSSDSDGSIASYAWAVGGYILGTGSSLAVTFPAGSYPVALTVTDDDGATATNTVVIGARDPDATDPDLVAWWRFDETSGLSAADSSGNGHDGALENLAGDEWETGRISGALRIDSGSGRVLVPHNAALNLAGQYSLSAWMKVDQIPFFGRVAIKGGESDGWGLVVPNAAGLNWVYAGSGYATPTNVLATAQWQHVAITYNGATLRYYVNGVVVDEQTIALTALPNTEPVIIGNHSSLARPLDGLIDELRLYQRVLSPLEIAGLAQETTIDTDGDRLTDDYDLDDDGDLLSDLYEITHGFDPLIADDATTDHDSDTFSTLTEYFFDTNPQLASDWPRPPSVSVAGDEISVVIDSFANRTYTLQSSDTLNALDWQNVAGQSNLPGVDGPLTLTGSLDGASPRFFRVQVDAP